IPGLPPEGGHRQHLDPAEGEQADRHPLHHGGDAIRCQRLCAGLGVRDPRRLQGDADRSHAAGGGWAGSAGRGWAARPAETEEGEWRRAMKRIALLLSLSLLAFAPSLRAAEKSYGAGVTLAETTSVAKILADPDAYVGKKVRIEGQVADVCP